MPDGHPYQQSMGRLGRLFEAQLVGATLPDLVARAIYDAVHEGGSKLRYPVGPDAELVAAARDRMTAAEWASLLTEEDEEKFIARAQAAFGADLLNPPSLNERLKKGQQKTSAA
jgi:hypothetical protein